MHFYVFENKKTMGFLARKLSEFETTVLNDANDWAGNHSTDIYNQTTGPQLQQAASYQMPIILTELSAWIVSMLQSWQSVTVLVALASVLLFLVISAIRGFVWQWRMHSTQRQTDATLARIEARLASMSASQAHVRPFSDTALY